MVFNILFIFLSLNGFNMMICMGYCWIIDCIFFIESVFLLMVILGKIDILILFKFFRILKGFLIYIIFDVFMLVNCKNDGFVNDLFVFIVIL